MLFSLLMLLLRGCGISQTGNNTKGDDAVKQKETSEKIKIETVKTASFSMHCFKFGHGKKTLVILPGLSVQSVMGSADAIAEAYGELTDDFTIYVFDQRKELPNIYTVSDMAKDTAEAFEAAGLDKVNIFGASLGGMTAMEIAIMHPKLVEKLILGSTSARITETEYQTMGNWVELAKEKDVNALYLAFGEAVYPPDVFAQLRELLLETAKTITEEDLDRFVILAQSMKNFDITQDLEKISCPVLAIGDRTDHVLGAEASKLMEEYLNGRSDFELYMYDGYGHAVYDTAPDFKERMVQFLLQDAKD